MVQLPPGRIEETRRGGADVLQILVRDMVSAQQDGYIRVERRPANGLPRIGHLLFREGQPAIALHQGEVDRLAIEALMELEEDAMSIDALLTLHCDIDTRTVIELYPEAILHLERIDNIDPDRAVEAAAGEWWNEERLETLSWKKATSLPDLIPALRAPDTIRKIVEARMARDAKQGVPVLLGGHLHLIDCQQADSVMKLAGELNKRGRPLISISRMRVEKQLEYYGEDGHACFWLVERPSEGEHIGPSLEGLIRLIEGWLDDYRSAVILLDGFEFLCSTHNDERAMGFLRRLADLVRDSDDLMLMPVDLDSWEMRLRYQMLRASDPLELETIEEWLDDTDVLDDHPFLELILDDGEALAVENEIAKRMGLLEPQPDSQSSSVTTPRQSETETLTTASLEELMKGWAEESSSEEDSQITQPSQEKEWTPTFHSGATGERVGGPAAEAEVYTQTAEIDEEDDENLETQSDEEKDSLGPRPALRSIRKRAKTNLEERLVPRSAELDAAVSSEKEIDERLPQEVSLMEILISGLGDAGLNANDILSELPGPRESASKSQKALQAGSASALPRIESSEFPRPSGELGIERWVRSWQQASEQERARMIAEWPLSSEFDQGITKLWKAAMDAATNPIHPDREKLIEVLGPMIARPGIKAREEIQRGKAISVREQRPSDPASIEKRLRLKELKRYKEWKMEGEINPDNLHRRGGE